MTERKRMSMEEARKIVFDCVEEHGREEALRILDARLDNDQEFMIAMARHGSDIFEAVMQSEKATKH